MTTVENRKTEQRQRTVPWQACYIAFLAVETDSSLVEGKRQLSDGVAGSIIELFQL
jgi:hypothetical protein